MTDSSSDLHRVTVNLIPKAWDAIERAAQREKLSRTDAINRALQVYDFFSAEMAEGKQVILLSEPGGEAQRVHIL